MKTKMMNYVHYLHLPGQKEDYDRYLKQVSEKDLSPIKFLEFVLAQEYELKQRQALNARLKKARIPEEHVLATFPFDRQPNLDKNQIVALYDSFDYIHRKQNVIFLGPTGTGKTGLSTAFLIHAINQGSSGRFVLFPDLIAELRKAEGSFTVERIIKRYAAYDCLVIDELGYVPVEPAQVGAFFTLMHKRHKRKTTFITSNLGFQDWISFLKNEHLTAALIDRLTDNSFVLNLQGCWRREVAFY